MKLQCGYEDDCKAKSCLDCPRKYKINLELTEAELTCIDDFGWVDIKDWLATHKEDLELSQNVMRILVRKIFKLID